MIICDRCKKTITTTQFYGISFKDGSYWHTCEHCLDVVKYCNIALHDIEYINCMRNR